MYKILELLKKISNLLLFAVALSQIFLYEAYLGNLERMLKVELLWRFLVNFGV